MANYTIIGTCQKCGRNLAIESGSGVIVHVTVTGSYIYESHHPRFQPFKEDD